MKIVFHHAEPLPVIGYGGIERILFWHMKELIRLGHEVILLSHPDSKVENYGIKLHPINNPNEWGKLIPTDADIIHLNFNYTVPGKIPTINTVHGNGQVGEIFSKNSVFVSKKHAEIHNSNQFIYNAIDLSEYPFTPVEKNWDQFLFLAKASWRVKNLKSSVASVRKNNKHLHIIGGRWWGLSRYIHSHGIIGGERKMELMRGCDALLFPVRWHEPFGIAMIEAMSQGLPIIGSPYGSLPEIINEETGIIVKDHLELENILRVKPRKFHPHSIRKYVEDNFQIAKYTKEYLVLYEKVINGYILNSSSPSYIFAERAEKLLPF